MSSNPQITPVHAVIRRLRRVDIEQVYVIERTVYPYPWSQELFRDCLRAGYACFGLQLENALAGYTIFNWAAGEAHMLNLCIHPHWQRQGYGSLLLDFAIERVSRLEAEAMYLEVRPSNPQALGLYASKGFSQVGRRPAYYKAEKGREDAIVMRLEL